MKRFNWGNADIRILSERAMDRAIAIVRHLEKEYGIEPDPLEGLYTILFDIAKAGYEGDE